MTQNKSHAVMAQRHEAHDSLDDFATPPYATRALPEHVLPPDLLKFWGCVWEPCCNRGYMARPLREYYPEVYATDIHDYGWDGMDAQADFLFPSTQAPGAVGFVVANPPFRLAEQFFQRAMQVSAAGCALLVRTSFLEGISRYNEMFKKHPPAITAIFTERVIMSRGAPRDPSKLYWDEAAQKWKRPSTATSYSWLVWMHGSQREPKLKWIPPCRKKLERPGDYARIWEFDGDEDANAAVPRPEMSAAE